MQTELVHDWQQQHDRRQPITARDRFMAELAAGALLARVKADLLERVD